MRRVRWKKRMRMMITVIRTWCITGRGGWLCKWWQWHVCSKRFRVLKSALLQWQRRPERSLMNNCSPVFSVNSRTIFNSCLGILLLKKTERVPSTSTTTSGPSYRLSCFSSGAYVCVCEHVHVCLFYPVFIGKLLSSKLVNNHLKPVTVLAFSKSFINQGRFLCVLGVQQERRGMRSC